MSSDLAPKADSEEQLQQQNMSKSNLQKESDIKENINSQEDIETMPDSDTEKGKTLPEPIRIGKGMAKLPSIGLAELTTILQGPNMPSRKLMEVVTEKLRIKNDESGSEDGSVGSGGGGVPMRGILDCILEASLHHQDSEDESEGEGDEIFVRELPCKFCKKIFNSTMKLKTHVLMTHSQEDPSVLNVRNQGLVRSRSGEGREVRGRKRSSIALSDANAGVENSKEKSIRSRHNSKEQVLKIIEKIDERKKSEDSPHLPQSLECLDTTVTSISPSPAGQEQSCDEKDSDLQSTITNTTLTDQSLSKEPESVHFSKTTKRKSSFDSVIESKASSSKKAKRSKSQSSESEKINTSLRRSLRKK